MQQTIGFIGGGRIVQIFLHAMLRQKTFPERIVIYDTSLDKIKKLQTSYPQAAIVASSLQDVAVQDLIFLAVHPPSIKEVCQQIVGFMKPASIVISLAPVVTGEKLANMLGTRRIVRMIPTAASYLNKGYNPVWISQYIGETEKNLLLDQLRIFGECPQVDEKKLEAYAIVTAMGPTYLWPQLHELHHLALEFGLSQDEAVAGIKAMLLNTMDLLYDSGLTYDQVVDLIPVKPLSEAEEQIRDTYRSKLSGLHKKLTGAA